MGFFGGLLRGAQKVIGKTVEVGKRIGGFIARHHQHIAPLAHGLAVASGNETAQRVTGLALAASQAASMGAGNYVGQRIADMRARHAGPAGQDPARWNAEQARRGGTVIGYPVGKAV